jgi:hypothetical protein
MLYSFYKSSFDAEEVLQLGNLITHVEFYACSMGQAYTFGRVVQGTNIGKVYTRCSCPGPLVRIVNLGYHGSAMLGLGLVLQGVRGQGSMHC